MDEPEPSEIVGRPGEGRVFSWPAMAGLGDAAPSGRVRLDTLARWLQDAARADLDELGSPDWLWIVRRNRLRVQRFPRWGEPCRVDTWCSGLGSMWAERRTTVAGEAGALVESVALWVCMDADRGRPVAPSPVFMRHYEPSAAGRHVRARLRHPAPPEEAASADWRFRLADLDLAAHVNNAAYWEVVEEELLTAGDEPARFDGEVEFRGGAQAGDVAVRSLGTMRWITEPGPGGELLASFVLHETA